MAKKKIKRITTELAVLIAPRPFMVERGHRASGSRA